MVAGLLRPDRGHIRIGDRTLFDGATDLRPEARRVGYVFQDDRLFPHRRVRANLIYGLDLALPANRWMSLDEATQFLGIGHLLGAGRRACRAARRSASRSAARCAPPPKSC